MQKLSELFGKICSASERSKKGVMVDLQTISEIRDEFWALERRAEAAEAKLADLKKQEPVGMVIGKLGAGLRVQCYFMPGTINVGDELFTRPAPAVSLSELLRRIVGSGALTNPEYETIEAECCSILRNIEEAK